MNRKTVLRFRLSGSSAFFKKPDVNSEVYFTYGQIHKPALLGLLGAVLGYHGYKHYEEDYGAYPEYYQRLRHLKLAVIPDAARKGYYPRKIQTYNNSTGYALKRGNLVVKEEWLEEPSWTIYLMLEGETGKKLAEMFLNRKAIYLPYLGKNDHPACISDVQLLDLAETEIAEERIHSLIPLSCIAEDDLDWDDFSYRYAENLPVALTENDNLYQMEKFIYTDAALAEDVSCKIYKDGDKNIVFY